MKIGGCRFRAAPDDYRQSAKGSVWMTIAVIGAIALVASVGSWFPPGIAVGLGLIALGAAIAFTPSRSS